MWLASGEWRAIYDSKRAHYAAVRQTLNGGYNAFDLYYRTKDTKDAVALAKALNRGVRICNGSIQHGNSCGECIRCRYSF